MTAQEAIVLGQPGTRPEDNIELDALTLVNPLPGLALDPVSGEPLLGAGGGGVSGPVLRPIGVRAVATARSVSDLPILGVGGVTTAYDVVQYLRAGASLVQVGTASFAAPRAAERIVRNLPGALKRAGARSPAELTARAGARQGAGERAARTTERIGQ